MTKREAEVELLFIKKKCEGDQELAHIRADEVLCELLTEMGYVEIVGTFKSIKKWYS